MAVFILGGGATAAANTPCVSLNLRPHKPYSKPSQLNYFAIAHLQSPKIKIRAFSARSSCRAESYKLRRAYIDVGVDYSGRRFTIGDVVNKDNLKFNRPIKSLQSLAADIIGILQVAAVFLVAVSYGASLIASGAVGLTVTVPTYLCFKIFYWPIADRLWHFCSDLFRHLWSGRLVEIFFSYVCGGDGDPNQRIEEKRWKMIGQYIALNGGVVTAEEIAPYLDPQETEYMYDESYMLPVLQLFNGQPKVDEEGNIIYHFPSVHCTPLPRSDCGKAYAGRWVDRDIQVDKFLKEKEWELGKFDAKEREFVSKLIFNNLLCSMLGALRILRNDSRSLMSRIFLPLLTMNVIYAACFGAIAFKRLYSIKKFNAEIIKRNEAREYHAKALELPNLSLKRKLSRARDLARRSSIGNNRILYKNVNDLNEQQDYERQEWDRRLEIKDGNGIKESKEETMKSKIPK